MAERKNPISRAVIWVVLLLLIVGLMGFGVGGFGGGVTRIGSVGDTEIGAQEYARAFDQEIRALEAQTGQRLTASEARSFGLDTVVLQRLVALAALEDEADDLGLSVGDEAVAEEIRGIQAFTGLSGQFDRAAYENAVSRLGLTVAEFEEDIRAETARTLLQGALAAGIAPPDAFVATLYDFARQRRNLTLVDFTAADLDEPIPAPTDAQIQAFYEANPERFTLPTRKAITYAWLRPQMLTDEVEVDEERVRELYDSRLEAYVQPERRLVERLVFDGAEAAQAAAEGIADGETSFDALVADRGLDLSDIDLGEVSRDDLGAAADPVFSAGSGEVVGPVETTAGQALFRVNAILNAQETPFDEVAPELRQELALSAAERQVAGYYESAADLLAGGATVEDLAAETPFEAGSTLWSEGEAGLDGSEIDALPAFREAAAAAEPGDFPDVIEADNGSLFALRVDEILEPQLQPLADVEVAAIEGWEAQERRERLLARAEAAQAELAEGADLSELGGTRESIEGLLRDGTLEGAPPGLVDQAFVLGEGETAVVGGPDVATLVRLDGIGEPEPDTPEAQQIRDRVATAAGQGIAEDVTTMFTEALQQQKGITLDQQAVNAVLNQLN